MSNISILRSNVLEACIQYNSLYNRAKLFYTHINNESFTFVPFNKQSFVDKNINNEQVLRSILIKKQKDSDEMKILIAELRPIVSGILKDDQYQLIAQKIMLNSKLVHSRQYRAISLPSNHNY
jgi:hypothetical protein